MKKNPFTTLNNIDF